MFTADLYKQATGKAGLVTVVTAYVPISGHPRLEAEYEALGGQLADIKHQVLRAKGTLQHCWLYGHLKDEYGLDTAHFSYSIADNPQKNSLAYHIVQAQKTEWLEIASVVDPFSDVFIWIDFGIFHLPGVTQEIIDAFLDRAESETAIAIPGCWEKNERPYNDNWPHWRFCGGVMVVPREFVAAFNFAMKHEYVRWLQETSNISWEVNALTRLEQRDPDFPVWWYKAGHDESLFTNYRATEWADGDGIKAATSLRRIERGHC
jgi:hypothetical protein